MKMWPCKIAVLMLLAGFGLPLAGATLSVANVRGYPGVTVPVPVSLRNPDNGVVAAQFDVGFKTSKLASQTTILGTNLPNHVVRSREIAPGVRRVLVYSLANRTTGTNVTLASLPFTVARGERVGSGPITAMNPVLARADGSAVAPVSNSAGTIFVTPVYRDPANGVVDLFFPSAPDQNYLVRATTNFVDWVNIATNLAFSSFLDLVDADAPNYPHRFYESALFDVVAAGRLGGVSHLADGTVGFRFGGLEGRSYVIQASTDLLHWENVSTNSATSGSLNFIDSRAGNFRQRFYRLQSGP